MATPKETISVGQLRRNPTQMIRDVRAGEDYMLIDRGVPMADIAPHRAPRWVSGVEATVALRALAQEFGSDFEWQKTIEEWRDTSELRDPWQARK